MKNISLVVVTGLSGAGKSVAAGVLEDLGYYIIDNLPLVLLERFVEMIFDFNMEVNKVALVIDSRSGDLDKAFEMITFLQERYYAEVIFLSATDEALIKRYKETRRTHPLGNNITDAIQTEREKFDRIQDSADLVIDTTHSNVHEFREKMEEYFKDAKTYMLSLTVQSFGFKHGLPVDSDLVFDVRFLKNPHFVDELREKTGQQQEVSDYVFSDPNAKEFLKKLKSMLSFLIPNYIKEGKRFLTISIGCTGGRHRSVAITEFIHDYLSKKTDLNVIKKHRDLSR